MIGLSGWGPAGMISGGSRAFFKGFLPAARLCNGGRPSHEANLGPPPWVNRLFVWICPDAETGELVWKHSVPREFTLSKVPAWGWAAHPLLDGDRLICLVGGTNSAVVAFQKDTGKEVWRALTAFEIGYCPPVIYTVHG